METSGTAGSSAPSRGARLRVLVWGTYDRGKPRTRILIRGLRAEGIDVTECHADVWRDLEDKTGLRGPARRLWLLVRWAFAYPGLIVRYFRTPAHDAVLVCHPGHLDVLLLFPWARLRGAPVVWDAFLGLYDTVVEDRRLVPADGLRARLIRGVEGLAARAADRVLTDTEAQAGHFARRNGLPRDRVGTVPVGVEIERFAPSPSTAGAAPGRRSPARPVILFYGQMIPLHGIDTILRAATSSRGRAFRWILVGEGQQDFKVKRVLRGGDYGWIEWVRWVPYDELRSLIGGADVCLGIFGGSGKAARVIPNKVYQALAAGKPLVTRDGPGIRELLTPRAGVRLIPPDDPEALVGAVEELLGESVEPGRENLLDRIGPGAVGRRARREIAEAIGEVR